MHPPVPVSILQMMVSPDVLGWILLACWSWLFLVYNRLTVERSSLPIAHSPCELLYERGDIRTYRLDCPILSGLLQGPVLIAWLHLSQADPRLS